MMGGHSNRGYRYRLTSPEIYSARFLIFRERALPRSPSREAAAYDERRSNALAVTALLVCAASLAGAITLVVDMDRPFEGFISISSQPMEDALALINAP